MRQVAAGRGGRQGRSAGLGQPDGVDGCGGALDLVFSRELKCRDGFGGGEARFIPPAPSSPGPWHDPGLETPLVPGGATTQD